MNHADRLKVLAVAELRRAAMARKARGGRVLLRRPPVMLYPVTIERNYRKALTKFAYALRAVVEARLIPELPRLVETAQAKRPTADTAARLDDYGGAIGHLLELIRGGLVGEYDDADVQGMVRRMAEAVASQNGREVGRVFKAVLGVDLFKAEPWLNDEVAATVQQNVALIKTVSEQYFDRIEQLVYDGARSGLRWEEIAGELRAAPFGRGRAGAELIARDQVGKFNGQLAKLRQVQHGVSRYVWRTSRDERVRASHRAMDGEICEWENPPTVGGRRLHPGDDYQCRCYAEPVLEDVVDGLDGGAGQ